MVTSVQELIADKGLQYKLSGKDVLIKCLNPDHADRDPSLRIDKLTGIGTASRAVLELISISTLG